MANNAPPALKSGLENVCKKAATKLSKAAPEKDEKKVAELLHKEVCKNVDNKILKAIAQAIADQAKKKNPKADPNSIDPNKFKVSTKMKKPSAGAYAVTVPITSVDLAKALGPKAKGKLSVDVWTDAKAIDQGGNTGAMLNFSVRF